MTIGAGPPVLDPSTPFWWHTTPGRTFAILVGGTALVGAAFIPDDPDADGAAVLDFDSFDEWREEDEVLVGHARDPFTTRRHPAQLAARGHRARWRRPG